MVERKEIDGWIFSFHPLVLEMKCDVQCVRQRTFHSLLPISWRSETSCFRSFIVAKRSPSSIPSFVYSSLFFRVKSGNLQIIVQHASSFNLFHSPSFTFVAKNCNFLHQRFSDEECLSLSQHSNKGKEPGVKFRSNPFTSLSIVRLLIIPSSSSFPSYLFLRDLCRHQHHLFSWDDYHFYLWKVRVNDYHLHLSKRSFHDILTSGMVENHTQTNNTRLDVAIQRVKVNYNKRKSTTFWLIIGWFLLESLTQRLIDTRNGCEVNVCSLTPFQDSHEFCMNSNQFQTLSLTHWILSSPLLPQESESSTETINFIHWNFSGLTLMKRKHHWECI